MAMRLGDGADAVGIEEAAGIVVAIVGGVTRAGAGGSGGRWRGVQVVAAGEDGRERGWRRWRRSGTGLYPNLTIDLHVRTATSLHQSFL